MKFLHLSDLHLGKRLREQSLLEDQKYILTEILSVIDMEKPDAILIAGDVYDKSTPSAEAVTLFDDFLVQLSVCVKDVFIISGNHDSPERLAFGGRLMDKQGIHLSPVYNGEITPTALRDEYGPVNVYMLPFVKPAHVRRFFPEDKIESYTDAIKVAVDNMAINSAERNVIITHQFVTGASRSESEEISVGGTDNVDACAFDGFDYVALGHIHGPQNIGSERIRYCGTPLKYSFSEAAHEKSVTVVELKEKGDMEIKTVPLNPKRDLVELRGKYNDLMLKSFYENTGYTEDYMHIVLTDEEDIPDAVGKLRIVYKNMLWLSYDNRRTRYNADVSAASGAEYKSPLELFSDLYETQNNAPMSEEQAEYMAKIIAELGEGEV